MLSIDVSSSHSDYLLGNLHNCLHCRMELLMDNSHIFSIWYYIFVDQGNLSIVYCLNQNILDGNIIYMCSQSRKGLKDIHKFWLLNRQFALHCMIHILWSVNYKFYLLGMLHILDHQKMELQQDNQHIVLFEYHRLDLQDN